MTERDRNKKAGNQLMELQNVMSQCGSNEFEKRSKLISELIQMWREAKQVQLIEITEEAIEEETEQTEHTEETIPEENGHTEEVITEEPIPAVNEDVGAQLRSQPILRWAIAQLRILSWVAYLKMG